MQYRITWEIDIDADTPQEAAKQARNVQLDPESSATVFDVWSEDGQQFHIDLMENEDNEQHAAGCVCADCSGAELTAEND